MSAHPTTGGHREQAERDYLYDYLYLCDTLSVQQNNERTLEGEEARRGTPQRVEAGASSTSHSRCAGHPGGRAAARRYTSYPSQGALYAHVADVEMEP